MAGMNIKDIAKICGVGVSTVSRALNNHPDINPQTRERIMQAMKEHNYVPNNSARNLKRQDARTIAVLVKGINNHGNYVEDSRKQIDQADENILYVQEEYKNEMYLTDVYEGEINLIPYQLLTVAYPLYGIRSEEKLGVIYIDLDFEAMKKNFSSLPKETSPLTW